VSLVTVQDIIETGRQASPTSTVLAEWAEQGTPKQREQLHGMLLAEHESRHASRRQRPLSAARLPALKSLTGFDYSSVKFPEDYGREGLTSLDFITRAEDLVLYGDVGTGKTHLASALVAAACREGIPAGFFTTSSLVMQLRRAKDDGRLDRELATRAKNQLLAIDEFGYLPIDTEGARLLCQVIADGYEKMKPDHHHKPRVLPLGNGFRRRQHGRCSHRPHRPPRPPPPVSRRVLPRQTRPHEIALAARKNRLLRPPCSTGRKRCRTGRLISAEMAGFELTKHTSIQESARRISLAPHAPPLWSANSSSSDEITHLRHVIGCQTDFQEGPQPEDGDTENYRQIGPRFRVLFPFVIVIAHVVQPDNPINVITRSILLLNIFEKRFQFHRPVVRVPPSNLQDGPIPRVQSCHRG
jgi:DNA replication protein DnaC